MGKYSLHVLERKHWVIFFSVLVGVGWFSLVLYTISASKQTQVVMPGSVATQSVKTETPRSVPSIAPDWKGTRAKSVTGHEASTPTSSALLPQPKMTSTSMHLRQTSDATAHNVGSGIATATYAATTSNGRSQKGVSYSGLGFGGNMFMLSSSLALASPGARQANDLTSVRGPQGRNGMKQTDGPPPGPFPDPVGDIAWGLMLLLTIAYATMLGVRRFRREER